MTVFGSKRPVVSSMAGDAGIMGRRKELDTPVAGFAG